MGGEFLPEQEDVISDARLINNHFVVSFMHNAHSRVRLYDLNGKLVKELPLPTLGTVTGIAGRQSHTEFFLGSTLLPLSHSELEVRLRYGRVGVLCGAEVQLRSGSVPSEPGLLPVQGWDNGFHVFGAQKRPWS